MTFIPKPYKEKIQQRNPFNIISVNRNLEIALSNTNVMFPITNWIDRKGEDCAPGDAVVCICGEEKIGWFSVNLKFIHTH